MTVWGATHYWYQADFTAFRVFWMPFVGKMDAIRYGMAATMLLFLIGVWAYLRTHPKPTRRLTHADVKATDTGAFSFVINGILLPGIAIGGIGLLFITLTQFHYLLS